MRRFSIDEAERCLPQVARLLRKCQRVQDKIAYLLETNDPVAEISNEGGFHFFMTEQVWVNRDFHRLYQHFYDALIKLGELGVVVRDLDDGIVDFPMRGSKEVFLCWQLGEDRIEFWHDHDASYEERRPIVDVDAMMSRSRH